MNQISPSDQTSPARRATPEQHALVRQALEDEDTYSELYCGIALWVSRLTNARTREEVCARADEILQEAVMQAFAELDMYDSKPPAANWLFGFALNIIQQMRQCQSREAARIDDASFIEGLSGRELAAQLGITEGAARVRFHRAKQQLRRAYSQLL